jgi:hypothetical protein
MYYKCVNGIAYPEVICQINKCSSLYLMSDYDFSFLLSTKMFRDVQKAMFSNLLLLDALRQLKLLAVSFFFNLLNVVPFCIDLKLK